MFRAFLIVMVAVCVGIAKDKSKDKPFVSMAPYYTYMLGITKDRMKRRAYHDSLVVVLESYHKRIGVK